MVFALALAIGTKRDPNFWLTAEQRGDRLLAAKKYKDAATTYTDPWRIGAAQYRNGDFEASAKTFVRVSGAIGAFDQGNAWLMHGQYEKAIASYDRALSLRPEWKLAEDNKALAEARKAAIDASGENRADEATDAYTPDEVVMDQKGGDKKGQPPDMSESQLSETDLQATWLRRVQTTPGDFLKAKFAWQAQQSTPAPKP